MQLRTLTWFAALALLGLGCPSANDDDSAVADDDDSVSDDDDSVADDDDSAVGDDDDSAVGDDDDSVAEPPRVLLFASDDDTNGLLLETYLGDDGLPVTRDAAYWDWDGVTPDPSSFDVILIFEGDDYGDGFTKGGDDGFTTFVANGGVLIRTEWGAYSIGDPAEADYTVDGLIPVVYQGTYEYGTTWTVTDGTHPIATSLGATWTATDDGCSVVTADATATVIATTDLCGPAITIGATNAMGGRVIHINSDLGADSSATPGAEVLRVMANAVWYGGL